MENIKRRTLIMPDISRHPIKRETIYAQEQAHKADLYEFYDQQGVRVRVEAYIPHTFFQGVSCDDMIEIIAFMERVGRVMNMNTVDMSILDTGKTKFSYSR